MIYATLKSSFISEVPKFLNYRVDKTFSDENFKGNLSKALRSISDSFDKLDHVFTTKLNKHTPKKKLIRRNSKPHINRNLRRAIMKMSSLKKIVNKIMHPQACNQEFFRAGEFSSN